MFQLLQALDTTKANGQDGISARMVSSCCNCPLCDKTVYSVN